VPVALILHRRHAFPLHRLRHDHVRLSLAPPPSLPPTQSPPATPHRSASRTHALRFLEPSTPARSPRPPKTLAPASRSSCPRPTSSAYPDVPAADSRYPAAATDPLSENTRGAPAPHTRPARNAPSTARTGLAPPTRAAPDRSASGGNRGTSPYRSLKVIRPDAPNLPLRSSAECPHAARAPCSAARHNPVPPS